MLDFLLSQYERASFLKGKTAWSDKSMKKTNPFNPLKSPIIARLFLLISALFSTSANDLITTCCRVRRLGVWLTHSKSQRVEMLNTPSFIPAVLSARTWTTARIKRVFFPVHRSRCLLNTSQPFLTVNLQPTATSTDFCCFFFLFDIIKTNSFHGCVLASTFNHPLLRWALAVQKRSSKESWEDWIGRKH